MRFYAQTPTPIGDHNEDEQRSTAFQLFTGAAPKKAAGAHPRRGSVEEEESFGFGDENDLQEAGVTPERAEERSKRFFEGSESLAGAVTSLASFHAMICLTRCAQLLYWPHRVSRATTPPLSLVWFNLLSLLLNLSSCVEIAAGM